MFANRCSDDCTKVQFLKYFSNKDQINKQIIDEWPKEAEVF